MPMGGGAIAPPPGYSTGYMVTQASASDPPFYGIFVPLKIPFEKF